ncbi:MAG TPA: hypothetical protein VGD81_01515 [Opitutaceae bacterium]
MEQVSSVAGTHFAPECGTQFRFRMINPRLDGLRRYAQELGDFVLAASFERKEYQRFLQFSWQPVDRRLQPAEPVGIRSPDGGGGRAVGDLEARTVVMHRRIQGDIGAPASEPAAVIAAEIEPDRVNPGFDRRFGSELSGFEIYPHERFLHHIAGGGFVSQIAENKSVERFAVAVDQLVERRIIAGLKRFDKRQVRIHGVLRFLIQGALR